MPLALDSDLRLLFMTPRAATWMLDGIVSSPDDDRWGGVAVSIEVERPSTPWFEAAMEFMLLKWAREQRVVRLTIRSAKATPQAWLDSAGTSLRANLVRLA